MITPDDDATNDKFPDNILEFKPLPEDQRALSIRHRKYDDHKHGNFEINERDRTVLCRRCGNYVDPFAALCYLAEQHSDLDYKVKLINDYYAKQQAKKDADMLKRIAKNKGGTML